MRMNKAEPPRSSGIFKPVGHVLLAFREAPDAAETRRDLTMRGFADEDIVPYGPSEMRELVAEDLQHVGVLASLGSEVNLARRHGEMAEQGYEFLVVHAPEDEQALIVGHVAREHHASLAQRYNRLTIEELIEPEGSPRA